MSRRLPQTLCFLIWSMTLAFADQNLLAEYAPTINVQCPSTPFVRQFTPQNQSIHPAEAAYIKSRATNALPDWKAWLGDGSAIGYDLSTFEASFSNIGIAISGGGYRAAQYGAGVLSGLDARNDSAKAAGTGGLLQVASYITGLSGGSWITGSLILNDFPTIPDMVFGNGKNLSGWLLDLNMAIPDGVDLFSDNNQAFYGSILMSVIAKANNSIDTSMTDLWARMISYHFLNQTSRDNFFNNDTAHGAGQLWSQIPQTPSYQQFNIPFPIVLANSRPTNSNSTTILPLNSTVYEISPLEFGSYDPNLSAMVNLTYAGTHLVNGQPDNGTACVTGFDQAGFVMASSASLFNQIIDFGNNYIARFSHIDGSGLLYVLRRQLEQVRTRAEDIANWPNPFQNIKPDEFQDSNSAWLELVDGSTNQANVPFDPLFVKSRALDVIVAVDGSGDTDGTYWPNGTSPILTSNRIRTLLQDSHQQFPPIPASTEDFIQTGVNARPTFFGCNPQKSPPEFPLVVYLPNAPPLNGDNPVSNSATFKLEYTLKYTHIFLDQVHNNTIGGFLPNSTAPDTNWGKCLQCAAVDRTRLKLSPSVARSDICSNCFSHYCYDPANPPTEKSWLIDRKLVLVDPDPQGVAQISGFFGNNKHALIGAFAGLAAFIGALIAFLFYWKMRRDRMRYQKIHDRDMQDEDVLLKKYRGSSDVAGDAPYAHGGTQ